MVLAFVVTVLPLYPELGAAVRAAVCRDVAEFVASQIHALPGFLRLPYTLALLTFNCLPALRYGRTFSHLHAERQAAYLSLWSDARLGPARDFIKLMRSCALLAYFDHDLVRACLEAARNSGPAQRERVA